MKDTFASSATCEASYPDKFPVATLSFVEPVGLFNDRMPIVHVKRDSRLFGSSTSDRSLIPHELGHVFHFAAGRPRTRARFESGYLEYLTIAALNRRPVTHEFGQATGPLVAFVEAGGIFSERFFAFAKRVQPGLGGEDLRRAFTRDELSRNRSLPRVLVDDCPRAGVRSGGRVTPSLTTASVEGAVYGAVYLDLAARLGLREAVGLVLDSNATTFAEFHTHVHGRGDANWSAAIDAVATTWDM